MKIQEEILNLVKFILKFHNELRCFLKKWPKTQWLQGWDVWIGQANVLMDFLIELER